MAITNDYLEPGSLLLSGLRSLPSLWRIMNGRRLLGSVDGLEKLEAHRSVYQTTSMEPRIKSTSLYLNNTQRMHKQNKTKSIMLVLSPLLAFFFFSPSSPVVNLSSRAHPDHACSPSRRLRSWRWANKQWIHSSLYRNPTSSGLIALKKLRNSVDFSTIFQQKFEVESVSL